VDLEKEFAEKVGLDYKKMEKVYNNEDGN